MSCSFLPYLEPEGTVCVSNRVPVSCWRAGITLGIAVLMLAAPLGIPAAVTANEADTDADTAATAPGDTIAGFALQFLGYPYMWAGNTPAGFDCSGFTQYVTASATGIDIGHDTAGQTAYGAFVAWGAWQPGDLVYFANTYGSGISHAGIYIGDGQFVHAENPSTGVTVSSLYSDYYSRHYYGAYRIG
jgi:cell wall-associated NlpC family hydrolase